MAALDFPSSPTLNQTYTANGNTWLWDGTSWVTQNNGVTTDTNGNATITGSLVMGSSFIRNRIINGGMDIWQRGTTGFSGGGTFTADRWLITFGPGVTAARSTDVPNSSLLYSLSVSGTSFPIVSQRIEAANCLGFNGGNITVSFWAKQTVGSGANTVQLSLSYANAADNFGTTTAGPSANFNGSTSWTYYTTTFTGLSALAANGLQLNVTSNVSGSSTMLFTGVQLEVGSIATPLDRPKYSDELARCQRYYVKSYAPSTVPGTNLGAGNGGVFFTNTASASTICGGPLPFGVTMRAVPTFSIWDNVGNVGKVSVFFSGSWTNNVTPSNAITLTSTCYAFVNYLGSVQNMSFDYTASAEL